MENCKPKIGKIISEFKMKKCFWYYCVSQFVTQISIQVKFHKLNVHNTGDSAFRFSL